MIRVTGLFRRRSAGDRRRLGRAFSGSIPPLDLLWSYRRRPATDLNLVKAAAAASTWRGLDRRDRRSLVLRYLRWLSFPMNVVAAIGERGAETRRLFGRGFSGQFSDMMRVAVANGLSPDDYYFAGLARYGGSDEIFRCIPHLLMHDVIRDLSRHGDPVAAIRNKDKAAFERRCRGAGLRAVRTIAIVSDGAVRTLTGEPFAGRFPDRDLLFKPIASGGGRGIEGWRSVGEDRFRGHNDAILSSAELAAQALSTVHAKGSAILIQERAFNSEALRPFSGDALSTTRIVTAFNEAGEPEIVDAFFRTSIVTDAPVDNFHARGLLFPVDIATGTFLPGMTDRAYDGKMITRHPQTGGLVAGRVHPGWQAMSEFALRLHRLFPEMVMPGWDIGFDADGPIAVEGNETPRFSLNRQSASGGLVGTRALALLALHAERWLAANEPEGSRWHVRARPARAARAGGRTPGSSTLSP